MTRWEYTSLPVVAAGFEDADEISNYQTILNQYGDQGWELVSTVSYPSRTTNVDIVVFVFKRPRV